MHGIALHVVGATLLAGCIFDASYDGGRFTCSDNVCPGTLACREGVCVPRDAGNPVDDARQAALTCADPGTLPGAGGTVSGTTVDRVATVSAMCGGFIMNGADAVYRIDLAAGAQLLVDIAGGRKAYVLAACMPSPATPACLTNTLATAGNPLAVSPAGGPSFVVVDDESPATSSYTLTVTVN